MNNKQYKLINRTTNEEIICTKVCIEGFDYFVSKDGINTDDYYISWETNYATEPKERYVLYNLVSKTNGTNPKKVIATNNPSFDIPQIVDKVEELAWNIINNNSSLVEDKEQIAGFTAFCEGYNTHAETHTLSDDEVIKFGLWVKEKIYINEDKIFEFWENDEWVIKTSKELLQLFKKQQVKTIYYNE